MRHRRDSRTREVVAKPRPIVGGRLVRSTLAPPVSELSHHRLSGHAPGGSYVPSASSRRRDGRCSRPRGAPPSPLPNRLGEDAHDEKFAETRTISPLNTCGMERRSSPSCPNGAQLRCRRRGAAPAARGGGLAAVDQEPRGVVPEIPEALQVRVEASAQRRLVELTHQGATGRFRARRRRSSRSARPDRRGTTRGSSPR